MAERFELGGRPVYTGAHVTHSQDDALLSGQGTYVADLRRDDMAEIAVVRSTVAHGRITAIRTAAAAATDGVIAVVTAADLTDVAPYPNFASAYTKTPGTFPLARDKVRYVGSPVAVVLAEDRYIAEDAAELVEVDYEQLPAVVSTEDALDPDSPPLFEDWPDNRLLDLRADDAEVAAILAANRTLRRRYRMGRHTAMPMETRAALAEVRDGRLHLWCSNQHAHIARTTLSYLLPLAERDIRVAIPHVGGGFGLKQHLYPEDVVVSWLALRHGRPVRYVEDRAEHMIAAAHAHDHTVDIEAAIATDGRILAMRVQVVQDLGSAEIFPGAWCPALTTAAHMTGP